MKNFSARFGKKGLKKKTFQIPPKLAQRQKKKGYESHGKEGEPRPNKGDPEKGGSPMGSSYAQEGKKGGNRGEKKKSEKERTFDGGAKDRRHKLTRCLQGMVRGGKGRPWSQKKIKLAVPGKGSSLGVSMSEGGGSYRKIKLNKQKKIHEKKQSQTQGVEGKRGGLRGEGLAKNVLGRGAKKKKKDVGATQKKKERGSENALKGMGGGRLRRGELDGGW